jgi:MFS family permease
MSGKAAGSIATGYQLGYAVSLVIFSALADRVGARRVFVATAWLSAIVAFAFALFARSYVSGLVLFTMVALSQGGTYTTAIMLVADRYPPERRGAAVGWLIARVPWPAPSSPGRRSARRRTSCMRAGRAPGSVPRCSATARPSC